MEIGVLGRPHGIRGALKVFLHNPTSSILELVEQVSLAKPDGPTVELEVTGYQQAAKHGILELRGVCSRDRAEELKGARVCVRRGDLPALEDGEFYVRDLVGLEVSFEDGAVGAVVSSADRGGVEVVQVVVGEEEIEVPLVDDFVAELDVLGRRLRVRNEAGLLRSKTRGGRSGDGLA